MKKKALIYARAIMSLILLMMLIVGCGQAGGEEQSKASTEKTIPAAKEEVFQPLTNETLDGMDLAAENDRIGLYISQKTTEIAVRDKQSAAVWYSNPQNRDEDPIANVENGKLLQSQFSLTFFNQEEQETIFDNYNYSVKNNQFEIKKIPNGVKIYYTLSNFGRGIEELPVLISKQRFEQLFLNKVKDEKDKELLLKRYKLLKEVNVYKRYTIPTFEVKRFLQIVDEVGYTSEDLQQDNTENAGLDNGSKAEDDAAEVKKLFKVGSKQEKVKFTIPLEYTLDKGNLVVNVPVNEIEYMDDYPLQAVKLLEFFGAADQNQTGYMFVPDGSGALIHLNNGKKNFNPFQMPLYGEDLKEIVQEKAGKDGQAFLPVFGMKQQDKAFLAIIENGDALAAIHADISGRINSYNTVYSDITVAQTTKVTLGGKEDWEKARSKSKNVFQDKPYQGDYRVRYAFLQGEQADYVGMADTYRGYLAEKYQLERLKSNDHIAFYIETIGAIEKHKSVLGFPTLATEPLTTYRQAQTMVEQLLERGIKNVNLRYSGWFNGGLHHELPTKIALEKKLGGKKGFVKLADTLKDQGVGFYPDVSFQTVWDKGNGFSSSKDASRLINQKTAKVYSYNPATFLQDLDKGFQYPLSPARLESIVGQFTDKYDPYGIDSISLRDMGNIVRSDFKESNVIDRQQAADIVVGQTKKLHKDVGSLLIEGGDANVLPYADHVVNVPFYSSQFNIEDEDIPFTSIVMHGYWNYTGEPINSIAETRRQFLKSIETGASLSFLLTYNSSSTAKDTIYDDLYSTYFGDWIDMASEDYAKADAVLREVQDQLIVDHIKLMDGVVRVTYENGISIFVNYNTKPVTIDGIRIEAESFARAGGGQ